MTRIILVLVIAVGTVFSVHADVVDLLKAGLAARSRGDFDAAINYYTQAIATGDLAKPYLAEAFNSRGVAYDIKHDPDRAIADFDAAIRLKPDFADAYINRGLAWISKRDYDRAIADFTEAATRNRENAFLAFADRAGAYEKKGDYDHAIEDYGRAINLRPDYPFAYYGRANVYYAKGEMDKAKADFDNTIRLKSNFRDAYINRGALYLAEGNTVKAIADFDAAIRLSPNDAVAFSNRGDAYVTKGEFERAITDFDAAIRLEPYSAAAYLKRGLVQFYSRHADAAVEDFASAVRLRPSDGYAVIWLHLARVRTGQDDRQEFARNAARVDHAQWPGPVVDLHLGSVSREVLLAASLSDTDAKTQRKRSCEIDFYLGTFDLEKGMRDEARRRLQLAANICVPNEIEFVAAKAELAGIESNR